MMRFPGIRPGVARLFRLAIRRPDVTQDDADEEIRLHLALRIAQLRAQGMSLDEARDEAERRFGPRDEARQRFHESAERREQHMRTRERLDAVRQDLRFALRGMRRNPGFVATAVICLALGIGANVATFSLFEELLLQPLPVHEPERLVNLAAPGPKPGTDNCNQAGSCDVVFSYPMFRDLEREADVFSGVAAHRLYPGNIAHQGRAIFGDIVSVSGSYFPVLGLRPALGRLLTQADDSTVGAHPVAVLTHRYWTERLGAEPAVLGTTILVNDKAFTVVGVASAGFEGTTVGVRPSVFVPLTMAPTVAPWLVGADEIDNRRQYWTYVFARLAPGVSAERASVAVNGIYRRILADVEAPLQVGMSPQTLERFKARMVVVEDGRRGQSSLHGETRTPLLLLFAITGLVVLVACANIANLLLARAATRSTEMAVRLSLGASRRRLVMQMLVESCLLALLGGIASLAVAQGTLALIGSLIPAGGGLGTGAILSLEIRPSVVAFAAALSLGAGLVFGMFPALESTRSNLIAAIRAGSGQTSGTRSSTRFRATLVTMQIALSMALLISAGLFIRSLRNVARVDLGVRVDSVVAFALAPMLNGYAPARSRALFQNIEDAIGALPGVTGVAASTVPLLTNSSTGGNIRVEGFTTDPDADANSRLAQVSTGYFRTLGVPILAGREFTSADVAGAPRVAIVNEAFARKFNLMPNPVGRRMARGRGTGPLDIEIVGLMKDAKYSSVKGDIPAQFFTPYRQDTTVGAIIFYARTSGATGDLLRRVPAVIAQFDANLPVVALTTMVDQVKENTFMDRMIGMLSAAFAAIATLLTAVGLYGVLAFTVAQRTREFGVRMALGANARRVRRMVMRQVGVMILIGGVIGITAALAAGRVAQSLLFQLEGHDPVAVLVSAAVLAVVATAAGYVPAWRASRVDPVKALRDG